MHSGLWSASQRTDTQRLCVPGPEGLRIRGSRLSWRIIKSARSPSTVFASYSFLTGLHHSFLFFHFKCFYFNSRCFSVFRALNLHRLVLFLSVSQWQKQRTRTQVHPPIWICAFIGVLRKIRDISKFCRSLNCNLQALLLNGKCIGSNSKILSHEICKNITFYC